jgi:cellulose synthase/poly-beta-1,6-N-acetylglucosamine synthase-like glycosyltransferase
LLDGPRRGAAAALNTGIRAASHELVAQIDQDVVIQDNWLAVLIDAMRDPQVAAAQGHYVASAEAGAWARVMSLDLAQRYRALGERTNHVCTGNSIYRKAALLHVGLFDETLGYGYDNDMSYRLAHAGFELAFCRRAISTHYWRDDLPGYVRQQYGFGYGRLDLVARHRRRAGGDNVSRAAMMLHAPLMLFALVAGALAAMAPTVGFAPDLATWLALAIVVALAFERVVAGIGAAVVARDPAGLLFPIVHLLRDAAWAAAIVAWTARRLRGTTRDPAHSMNGARRRLSPSK